MEFRGRPLAPVGELLPLADLEESQCRWPVLGEGTETLFCAAPAAKAFCSHHASIAYLPGPDGAEFIKSIERYLAPATKGQNHEKATEILSRRAASESG